MEEYVNLCSYKRIIEDKENIYQRVVIKEDGVTRCETMQVFAPEDYQRQVEEWCSVYNGGGKLDGDKLLELYSLRSRVEHWEFIYKRKCSLYDEMRNRYLDSSEENARLESEREELKSERDNCLFWKSCSFALFLMLCVLFYIMMKSNL